MPLLPRLAQDCPPYRSLTAYKSRRRRRRRGGNRAAERLLDDRVPAAVPCARRDRGFITGRPLKPGTVEEHPRAYQQVIVARSVLRSCAPGRWRSGSSPSLVQVPPARRPAHPHPSYRTGRGSDHVATHTAALRQNCQKSTGARRYRRLFILAPCADLAPSCARHRCGQQKLSTAGRRSRGHRIQPTPLMIPPVGAAELRCGAAPPACSDEIVGPRSRVWGRTARNDTRS